MDAQQRLDVLKKVSEIATLAGIRGDVDDDGQQFVAGFELEDDRSQMVFVRPTNWTVGDSVVITFISPCVVEERGFMKGMKKDQAIDLLRRNEQTMFARYGLVQEDAADVVVASVDCILDTLDAPEFHAHIWHVAMAADAYEKDCGGGDDF